MAHSLGPLLTPAANATRLSYLLRPPTPPITPDVLPVNRRAMVLGLTGALWSSATVNAKDAAKAAARRPPPPPPQEKKDPNVSGVQAKVLASKKRKEDMKAAMAKLKERGKPVVDEPSSRKPVADEPPSSSQ